MDLAAPAAAPAPVEAVAAAPAAPFKIPLLPVDPAIPARPDELLVGTWSVENLFDTADDPAKDDKEFLPENGYSEPLLQQHLASLGRVIRSINGGRGPDVLALTEVENKAVAERLRTEALGDLGYQPVVLEEGPDARGIDLALLTRFPLMGPATLHPVVRPEDGKQYRGILEATLNVNGRPLTVFVNHWYATRAGMDVEKTHQQRMVAVNVLRQLIDARLKENPGREVVVLGDFNVNLGDRALTEGLGATERTPEAARDAGKLYDTVESVQEMKAAAPDVQLGTHYYHPDQSWSTFDHALVSPTLLDDTGLAWVPGSTAVVKNDVTADEAGLPRRFFLPRVKSPDGQVPPMAVNPLGASDHFPVVMRLRKVGDDARQAPAP